MAEELELDPVSEALKGVVLHACGEARSESAGIVTDDLIALVECYRGVREDDRLLKLEAAVGNLVQQVRQLQGQSLAGGEQEMAQLGRRLG